MQFSKVSTVLAPPKFVYDWHARDGAFNRLLPPWESVKIMDTVGPFDERFTQLQMKRFGIAMNWLAQHVDVVPGQEFTDIQVKGPFKSWRHTHQFLPLSDIRTKMIDTIDLRLPLHFVSKLFGGWSLKRDIIRMLNYRHEILKHDLKLLNDHPLEPQVIGITGASGMIGQHLTHFLKAAGHTVKHFVRKDRPDWSHEICWDPEVGIMGDFSDLNVIIHLAGESIASPIRWDQQKKNRIRRSRVRSTQAIVTQLSEMTHQVHTFICASAVGIYSSSQQPKTEAGPKGDRFLSKVVADWEAACDPIRDSIRVVNARFGTVLHPSGGVVKRLNPLMKLGALGRVGRGDQYTSWVSLDDAIRSVYFMIANQALTGPVNVVAPHPQTQLDWIKEWAKAVIRPAVAPLPETVVSNVMGEMGEELLLQSLRVVPKKLMAAQFPFQLTTMRDVCHFYKL
ncbi:MAG: TIGR01777 family oxidoreductase [Candidatus Margulisiibacteriota bacterium]